MGVLALNSEVAAALLKIVLTLLFLLASLFFFLPRIIRSLDGVPRVLRLRIGILQRRGGPILLLKAGVGGVVGFMDVGVSNARREVGDAVILRGSV